MSNNLFTNNAGTTLSGSINDTQTSISVVSSSGFPSPTGGDYFYATMYEISGGNEINIEIVKVTAVVGTTWTVVRAQDGTTGRSRSGGATVHIQLRWTAASSALMLQKDRNLADLPNAGTARTNLGLGTLATQAANNVAVTGGSVSGTTIDVLDNAFSVSDSADPTKKIAFEVSGVGAGITRTFTWPNASGTVALTSDISGSFQPLDAELTAIAALSSNGLIARTSASTAAARTLTGPAAGITVTNGDGASGNPTLALANDLAAVEGMTSTGFVRRTAADTWSASALANADIPSALSGKTYDGLTLTAALTGFTVAGGTTSKTLTVSNTLTLAGTDGSTLNIGAGGTLGSAAYTAAASYALVGSANSFSGTQTFGGDVAVAGALTNGGVAVATISGAQTLTNKTISGSSNTLSNIGNAALTNSSVTVNGTAISLGGSGTITANNPNALSLGSGLAFSLGTTYDGSVARTLAVDSTVATLTGSQTLTNKTISGASNTLSNIGNAALTNSSLTVNGTAISLGGSGTITANNPNALSVGSGLAYTAGTTYDGSVARTLGVDTSVVATLNGTQTLVNKTISGASNTLSNIANASLANSSLTVNGTAISLGGSGTVTANTTNALTFNNGGAGDASGTTFNGAAARTISYNTVGAPSATGAGASGTWGISISGNAATSSSTSGNAATATALQTARTINGTSFNGTANITIGAPTVAAGTNYYLGTGVSSALFGSGSGLARRLTSKMLVSGSVRVQWQATAIAFVTITSRVYKNGVAQGTSRSLSGGGAGTTATYTEDVSVSVGDNIEIFASTTDTDLTGVVRGINIGTDALTTFAPHLGATLASDSIFTGV